MVEMSFWPNQKFDLNLILSHFEYLLKVFFTILAVRFQTNHLAIIGVIWQFLAKALVTGISTSESNFDMVRLNSFKRVFEARLFLHHFENNLRILKAN